MVADRDKAELKAFEQNLQNLLEAEKEIERATSGVLRLENILDDICHEIQLSLGFDFANISLVLPEQNTIEALHGTGTAKQWAGRVKHYLEEDPDLQDIQANIIKTRLTEIISGWDRRFDRGVYNIFHHKQLVRVFTPIILLQDESGKVIKDWFERCQWKVIAQERNGQGQRTVIEMHPPGLIKEVIGTVEAGYESPHKRISYEQTVDLTKLVARRALDIRRTQLSYLLETIAENARRILQADFTTLHFLWEIHQERYIYEVCTGCISHLLLKDFPPRKKGLGWQAINERKPKFIPDPSQGHDSLELERLNPKASEEGSKAYLAFPLLVEDKEGVIHDAITTTTPEHGTRQVGVLYVHFHKEHQFIEDELRWGELFARRAVDAIWHTAVFQQIRDRARQLTTLHSVTQSLNRIAEEEDLLCHIAWNTLNILAADVVIIYEFIQSEKQFLTPPCIVGQLREEQEMDAKISEQNVPFLLIKHGESVYDQPLVKELLLRDSPFANREKIESAAGIILKADEEILGVMFVNYRRFHYFPKDEQQIIETLAASAALAIKNQRTILLLSDIAQGITQKITTTLDQEELLHLIVQHAVNITGADLGNIGLLEDLSSSELVVKAKYPKNTPVDSTRIRIRIGEGITGWVAAHRQSELVNNVQADPRYQPYFTKVGSELCVPLLDKDNRVNGVLNVESYQTQVFNRKHLWMLKNLANLAVIAIQNVQSKDQLVKAETMIILDKLAVPLVHRMNNNFGAIRTLAKDILNEGNESSKGTANQILSLTDQVLQEKDRVIKSWIQEKPEVVDLRQAVFSARDRVLIPDKVNQSIELAADLPRVLAGEQQLTIAFENLIQNAVDAMPKGGRLSISGSPVKRDVGLWVEVQVCDTGEGIAEENIEKIFQPDYTTKGTTKGIGIGLWWTRTYVENLGGHLTVDSVFGESTQFTVKLPAYRPTILQGRRLRSIAIRHQKQ